MSGPPPHDAKRWLDQARYDLEAAAKNADIGFPEVSCFLAHQSAEKALKAFLYGQRESGVRGHSVQDLAGQCAEYDPGFSPLKQRTAPLDLHYIPTRYPNGLPDGIPHDMYTEPQARDAIALGSHVLSFVTEKLEAQYPGQW